MEINLENAMEKDKFFDEGVKAYEEEISMAQAIANELTKSIIDEVVKTDENGEKANKLTVSTGILACARAMVNLASYSYDNEDKYKEAIQKNREKAPLYISAITKIKPCGECGPCKDGYPHMCQNPVFGEPDHTIMTSNNIPLMLSEILECDTWNKIIYAYTEGREEFLKSLNKQEEGNTEGSEENNTEVDANGNNEEK